MGSKTTNLNNPKKIALGTITSVAVCSLSFIILTQSVKASVINQTKIIPTAYSPTVTNVTTRTVPKDNVKADYAIKISDDSGKPSDKDISAKDAAELGVRDIHRIFGTGIDLKGKTIDMSYWAVSSKNLRAQWCGDIIVDKNLSYFFIVDSVTGECLNIGQYKYLSKNINTDMDKNLIGNTQEYKDLAIKTAEKYNLVYGKIVSAEYLDQGAFSNSAGKNSTIDIMVKSENGQEAQLTFSRYNQELLTVGYDQWVKDCRIMEARMIEETQKVNKKVNIITDNTLKSSVSTN